MKLITLCCCLVASLTLAAQTEPVMDGKQTLKERYQELKSKSETFKEYKVIREWILDREWKVMQDSIQATRLGLQQSRGKIGELEKELLQTQEALKAKEESIAPLELAGSHIGFIGIDFKKGAFIGAVLTIIALLVCATALAIIRMKSLQGSLNEKTDVMTSLMKEYEDYKHKALDKQTKLSRELQTERNKLVELRRI